MKLTSKRLDTMAAKVAFRWLADQRFCIGRDVPVWKLSTASVRIGREYAEWALTERQWDRVRETALCIARRALHEPEYASVRDAFRALEK